MWQPVHHLMSQNILAEFKAYPRGKNLFPLDPKAKKNLKKKKKAQQSLFKEQFKNISDKEDNYFK